MGAEAILAAISDETARQVEAVLSDGRHEARRILVAARRDARERIAEAVAEVEPELAADAARRVNAVRLELLHRRAELSAERLVTVFEAAEARLGTVANRGGSRWRLALERLSEDAVEASGAGSTGWARPKDLALLRGDPARPAELAALRPDAALAPGLVVRSADGRVEFDATLPVRLARSRAILAERLAAVLGTSPS